MFVSLKCIRNSGFMGVVIAGIVFTIWTVAVPLGGGDGEIVLEGTVYGWAGGDSEQKIDGAKVEVWRDGQPVAGTESNSGKFKVQISRGRGPVALRFKKTGYATGQLSCSSSQHASGELSICLLTTAMVKEHWTEKASQFFLPSE